MPDSLGPVVVPVPPQIIQFPLTRLDYTTGEELEPVIITHTFGAPGLKTEQRFYRGDAARRFRIRKYQLNCHEYETLRDHWNEAHGLYGWFMYNHPKQNGTTEAVRARYSDPVLNFEHAVALATGDPGLTLVEAPDPEKPLTNIASVQTDDGVPSATLAAALRVGVQKLVPLVQIVTRSGTVLALSDRRTMINGVTYLPRLINWSGIAWSINGNNDAATFTFGNADSVWTELRKQVSLRRARVQFSLFDAQTNILLNLWSGYVREWSTDPASRAFSVVAQEGLFEMTLPYPTRQISRTCWKQFKSAWCPYAGALATCDKSWEQCVERGMTLHFGGAVAKPQTVRIQDNSTGTWGWGRSRLKSVSIAEDTIYQRVLQEIWTDLPMVVNCDVANGRDESEFYSALGIVGEGSITGFSTDLTKHLLDGAPPHDPQKGGGWRFSTGRDPAVSQEFFGLSQAPWNTVPAGSTYAAGTAFAEIRRTDAKGLQLSKVSDRKMSVTVTGGMGGWTWTAPGTRFWTQPLTNPVWIACNVFLRGIGLKADYSRPDLFPASVMESWLKLDRIIAAAAIADTEVTKLVGTGTERQFPFRGTLREQKPLRDMLQEILDSCLGVFSFVNGKLAIDIRVNSSVSEAFTVATTLRDSVQISAREAAFNHLTAEFADEEYQWALNSVQVYDIDHANLEGSVTGPRFKVSRMPMLGVSNKSQASRIVMTRLKEELGGATETEQANAANVRLGSTVIALGAMPGQIADFSDTSVPGGRVEFRINRRELNPDFSMTIEGPSTTDSMYDAAMGPKPDDVTAEPVPPERFQSQRGLAWLPNEESPETGDPLRWLTERSFSLWQDYSIESEGTYSPSLVVRGEKTINQFIAGMKPCLILRATWSQTGGTLAGGNTYYFVAAQRNAAGNLAPLSNVVAVWFPPGVDTYQVTLDLQSMETLPGHAVWMGTDPRRMVEQINAPAAALPASVTITGWTERLGRGAPSDAARAIRIKCKEIEHSGVAGLEVQQVLGTTQIRSSEFIGSTDNWVNEFATVVADADDGRVPLWNFRITAFDAATGTLTLDPPCVRGTPEDSVQPGDVLIVRARVTAASANSVTCALWNNSIGEAQWGAVDGLIPGAEKDLLVRIIAGKGAGQVRKVVANDNITHTIDPPWDVIPDITSIYIVEYADWVHEAETTITAVPLPNQDVDIAVRVDNLTGNVALVAGYLIDDEGNETAEELAVLREIYVYGQPYEVRRMATGGTSLTDQTLRIDTSAGDVIVPLGITDAIGRSLGSAGYFGRTILVVNDGTGPTPGAVRVRPLAGDEFNTHESEVVLATPGEWVEFVAAGDPAEVAGRRRAPLWNFGGRRRLQYSRRNGGGA